MEYARMAGEPLTILLVEDNADHAELVLRSLRNHHIANEIRHVTDGAAALDYLFQRGLYANPKTSPRPHVVLLDLRLPKVDGLEVLRAIKTHKTLVAIPVVILTTSEAETDIARAYEFCANSYLVKPMGFPEFAELMNALGFYWLCWNRPPKANPSGEAVGAEHE